MGNYDQYPDDGFLCFIEPRRRFVRRLWKKIPAAQRVAEIQEKMNSALQTHPDVRDVKWWTYEEFNNPGG